MENLKELKNYIKNVKNKISRIETNESYKENEEKINNGIRIPYNEWKSHNNDKNSLFFTYLKLSQLEKELLSKKEYQKEQKKTLKEQKAILKAGAKFKKYKKKNNMDDKIIFDENERERKQFEQGFEKV